MLNKEFEEFLKEMKTFTPLSEKEKHIAWTFWNKAVGIMVEELKEHNNHIKQLVQDLDKTLKVLR
jgi:hypothetical protein